MTIFSLKLQTFVVSNNCLTFLLWAFNNSPLTPRQQHTRQTQPWSKPKSRPSTSARNNITTKSSWVYSLMADFWGNFACENAGSLMPKSDPGLLQDFLQWRRQQQPLDTKLKGRRGERKPWVYSNMARFFESGKSLELSMYNKSWMIQYLPKCCQLEDPMPGNDWIGCFSLRILFLMLQNSSGHQLIWRISKWCKRLQKQSKSWLSLECLAGPQHNIREESLTSQVLNWSYAHKSW